MMTLGEGGWRETLFVCGGERKDKLVSLIDRLCTSVGIRMHGALLLVALWLCFDPDIRSMMARVFLLALLPLDLDRPNRNEDTRPTDRTPPLHTTHTHVHTLQG